MSLLFAIAEHWIHAKWVKDGHYRPLQRKMFFFSFGLRVLAAISCVTCALPDNGSSPSSVCLLFSADSHCAQRIYNGVSGMKNYNYLLRTTCFLKHIKLI